MDMATETVGVAGTQFSCWRILLSMRLHLATAAFMICAFVAPVSAQTKSYPRPQIASATGKPAPDFVLQDQSGNAFQLADQRGKWALLYFYRGYW
jgi:cytochrome oxidase Cu insertion factor (SCO1/SenC/PrrC family)